MARPITVKRYKRLCRMVHTLYGKPLGMSYFHSCACVDEVYFGRMTEDKMFELLDETLAEEGEE
jgi:hypothetical protein